MAILHAHTVVSLGDIAYYVRNRVEVSRKDDNVNSSDKR